MLNYTVTVQSTNQEKNLNKNEYLTVGQMAAFHKINKRTLMYYDDIGLFSPSKVGDNEYRYYTLNQSSTLEAILTLRELNVSIADISSYMKSRSPKKLAALIDTEVKKIGERIAMLNNIKMTLNEKQCKISAARNADIGKIKLCDYDESEILLSPNMRNTDNGGVSAIAELLDSVSGFIHLYNHSYGSIIERKHLIAKETDIYDRFFVRLDETLNDNSAQKHYRATIPAGKYMELYWQGSWETLPLAYEQLLSYAKENSLSIVGNSYEENIIDDFATADPTLYVTKISVHVAKPDESGNCKQEL